MTSLMRIVTLGLSLCLFAHGAAGQTVSTTAGAINGTVSDTTKAILPGVTVTLSGAAVMGTPTAVTDQNGFYRFPVVPPGNYKLTFELAGFGTVIRDGIRVSIGFTATVNTEMNPAGLAETVTVSGESPVVDLQSTTVASRFDSDTLKNLPGSRDFWALMAVAPAVAMSRMDVGGSGAWTQQSFRSYGLTEGGGTQRTEVEGIMTNEGNYQTYYTDYGSFEEIVLTAVGNTAETPGPGFFSQLISKSGGNTYHGNIYFDYENESMQAHNIDDAQVAAGVRGSQFLDARDLNRLESFRDFTADIGGYVQKDKVWWYAAFRDNRTGQRYPTLIDDVQDTSGPVYSGKLTVSPTPTHRLIGYYQHAGKHQPDYLGAIRIGGGRNSPALMSKDTVWDSGYPNDLWKAEYNAVLTSSLFLVVRGGSWKSTWWRKGKSTARRVEDIGSNFVAGGVYGIDNERFRPQATGSLSYSKTGWGGSHNFKFGGEVMDDTLEQPFRGFPHPSNSMSVFNNGVPIEVDVYQSPTESKNGLWAYTGYVNDTWQVSRRVTLTLGLRLDRYRPYLPAQEGPGGQSFPAVDEVLVWNNWGPRLGATFDLTGDGRTVVKGSYGQYWVYPSATPASQVNPNQSTWFRRYAWADPNGNGVWDPGEEGRLIAVSGGTASTTFDPDLENTFVRQGTAYLEREVAPNFAVRTGFVWNGRREARGQVNVNRPLNAYTVPVRIQDPGPDGRLGTGDDGGTLTAFNLAAEYLALPVVNITRNLPENTDDYYTWEITATRRQTGRWSLLATFAETWSHESALGTGTSYTPNALINAEDGRNKFKTWQAKVTATMNLNWDLRVIPIVRHQSGTPFARTFVQRLNYGSATIKAEPVGAERTPNITVVDVRTEKWFSVKRTRIGGFFDVYNIFNTNAEQDLSTSSGASWLRPSAITPPRIARVGIKLDW